jgi:tetratricopeptide (TPR) repeat protein
MPGEETTYAVAWRCPKCNETALDVCPSGAIEPSANSCINCGAPVDEDRCDACGMSREDVVEFLGLTSIEIDDARSAFAAGLIRRGFAILDARLQRDPNDVDAWSRKAANYRALRLDHSAVRCFRRAIAIRRDAPDEIALALALSALGRFQDVVATYDAVLETHHDPNVVAAAYGNRANARAALGDVAAAASDYEEALRREPARDMHYRNYAMLLARNDQRAKAYEVLRRGLDVFERGAQLPLWLEMSEIANEAEEADVGLDAADAVLAIDPKHLRGLYLRGWALGMLGRLQDARDAMQRIVDLDPSNEDARAALEKIAAALA